jgi:hypothetical protein
MLRLRLMVLAGLALLVSPAFANADSKVDHGFKGAGWYDSGESPFGIRLYAGPYSTEANCIMIAQPTEAPDDRCVYYDQDPNG